MATDDAFAINRHDMPSAVGMQQLDDSSASSASADHDEFAISQAAARQLGGVDQPSQYHHSRAVLVVVEDRNIQLSLQVLLNLEAFGRSDILEVNRAKAWCDRLNRSNNLLWLVHIQHDWHGIDTSKVLKQQRLTFHHRHGGFGAKVAQAQNGRAITNDCYEVIRPGVGGQGGGVICNCLAHCAHTRAVVAA